MIRYVYLLTPLLWFALLWLNSLFGIDITPDWLFYDSNPSLNAPPSQGLISYSVLPILFFLVTPMFLLFGAAYTAYKKLWWWFGAYIILGGGYWFFL